MTAFRTSDGKFTASPLNPSASYKKSAYLRAAERESKLMRDYTRGKISREEYEAKLADEGNR